MWQKENLQNLVKDKMKDYLFILASNRQPYAHVSKKGIVECHRGIGGVISALDPVMQTCEGLWVAYGNGESDRDVTDPKGKVRVPPDRPRYTLKRVWLTKEEEQGYYYGYANEVLWPLCHMAFERPIFRAEDWECYKRVNEKFAQAIIEEVGDKKAFVWVQDYHLCLLPKYLKEKAAENIIIAHFWHIPWPCHEVFRICPQKKEILEGLLANDLLGFHTQYHCNNFLDVIDREVESKIDRERFSVIKKGRETLIRPYPISVDFEGIDEAVDTAAVQEKEKLLVQEFDLSGRKVLIGLDRIDYTKGLPDKLRAFNRLLEKHPELCGQVVFLQVGVITRLHIKKYKELNDEINALVEEINWRYGVPHWTPVIFIRRQFSLIELIALYRVSTAAVISSLHDGMNLVAKEYVSSQSGRKGMLILSQFTGAARELTDAILINPYDCEQFSEGIFQALTLPEDECQKRMAKMREVVREYNIYHWAGRVISELLKFEFQD